MPARSAFTEHSKQHDSPAVTPVLDVPLAATHFCLGKVKPEAKSRYLLSYGQFAAYGGVSPRHKVVILFKFFLQGFIFLTRRTDTATAKGSAGLFSII